MISDSLPETDAWLRHLKNIPDVMTFSFQCAIANVNRSMSKEGRLSYDNDSPNWVYFDDFKVTHTKTNINTKNK